MEEETSEVFVSGINVRELISIYENKVHTGVDYTRPRAHSLGNVLDSNVTVQYNEYYTLEDTRDALEKVQANLNLYLVYDKQKHVSFQERLFNILTGIIGVRADEDEGPEEKKKLIAKTQRLVSFLNQKLPNNRSTSAVTRRAPEAVEPRVERVSRSSSVASTSTDDEISVSVKKLRRNFLPEDEPDNPSVRRSKTAREERTKVTKKPVAVPKEELKREDEEIPESSEAVSVTKLRSLFEAKKKENNGLEVILDAPRTFQYEVKIPYTEGNLGKYRLYRANSGHYLNYAGLLQNVEIERRKGEITRSKSLHGLDDKHGVYGDKRPVQKHGSEIDSGEESDTSTESVESVKEASVTLSSAMPVKLGTVQTLIRTIDAERETNFQSARLVQATRSKISSQAQSYQTIAVEGVRTTVGHSEVENRSGTAEVSSVTDEAQPQTEVESKTAEDVTDYHEISHSIKNGESKVADLPEGSKAEVDLVNGHQETLDLEEVRQPIVDTTTSTHQVQTETQNIHQEKVHQSTTPSTSLLKDSVAENKMVSSEDGDVLENGSGSLINGELISEEEMRKAEEEFEKLVEKNKI